MMVAASLITAPFAGAAELPDVPAIPIPTATSVAIKIVRIRLSVLASVRALCRATLTTTMSVSRAEPPVRPIQIRSGVALRKNEGRQCSFLIMSTREVDFF